MTGFLQIVGEDVQVETLEIKVSHSDTWFFITPKGDKLEIIEVPKYRSDTCASNRWHPNPGPFDRETKQFS